MNNDNKLIPKLRFPEFKDSGEWEEKKLGEICEFLKGKGISKADADELGKLPCIRYGELYTHYREVIKEITSFTNLSEDDLMLSEINDVIIPSSGETKEDIATASCVKLKGVALGGDLNILRSKLDGEFLAYYLSHGLKKSISKIAQGDAIVHLYSTQLKKLSIKVPTKKEEQQKIAACLSSIDEVITGESRKLELLKEHKKGLLQNLFPQEGEALPKLRFPEFKDCGKWEEKKLGDVFSSYSGGTPSTSHKEFYGGNIPFIRSAEINKSSTELYLTELGLNNSSAKMVNKGDLLVALYGANSGDVAISKIQGAINQAILCLKSKFSNTFAFHFLSGKKDWIIARYIQGGQGNLSGDIIKTITLAFPSKSEQQKIAACLSSLDDLIAAQSQKIETLKLHKKGLLQGLFPPVNEESNG